MNKPGQTALPTSEWLTRFESSLLYILLEFVPTTADAVLVDLELPEPGTTCTD